MTNTPIASSREKLHQAADCIDAGHPDQARQILQEIIASDHKNLAAWELLSRATSSKAELVYCLKTILAIQPDHPKARKALDLLEHPRADIENPPAVVEIPEQSMLNSGAIDEPPVLEIPPAPPPLPVAKPLRPSTEPRQPIKNPAVRQRRNIPFIIYISGALGVLCVGLWGYYLLINLGGHMPGQAQQLTQTALALQQQNCQGLIDEAMQAAGNSCDKMGGNSVCYGNFTLRTKLVPGSTSAFTQRGDIISVKDLQQLSAAPLNTDNHEWGIAIFKVMANLPRSLPGETVTLMVFGNTTIDNQSTSLETFYFSSQLGKVVCDKVPFDGITIDTPEGTGTRFVINGTELTLMGNASLKASQGGSMQVSLFSGSGRLASNGVEQYFGAGQSVSVALGGDNGLMAIGGPSAPVPLSPAEIQLACTMYGQYCSAAQITPVDVTQAIANIQSQITPTILTPTNSPFPTATASLLPSLTPSLTITLTFTATGSRTSTRTATRTRTATATRTATLVPTVVVTNTTIPSSTFTATTFTSTPSDTPTDTLTYTPTVPGVVIVNIIVPASDGTSPSQGQTHFEADAWDTAVGTTNGDGITHVNFWFSDSALNPVSGLPDVGSPMVQNAARYCAFGGSGTCQHMNPATFTALLPDTYIMSVQAYGVSGTSGIVTRTFVIP
jgi:hypothetical protein